MDNDLIGYMVGNTEQYYDVVFNLNEEKRYTNDPCKALLVKSFETAQTICAALNKEKGDGYFHLIQIRATSI